METFMAIVFLVFGILQIILFFKIWGMTNNVKKIKNKLFEDDFFFPVEKLFENTSLVKSAFAVNVQKINKLIYLEEKLAARHILLLMRYNLERYCNTCEKYIEKEVQELSVPFFKEIDEMLAKL
nr:MAG TPA: hypothetical protein [Caudoviricetes sp.]